MRIARILALLAVSLFLAEVPAPAQVTDVQVSPSTIVAGNCATFTASYTPTPMYFLWDYRFWFWPGGVFLPNPPDRKWNIIIYTQPRVGAWYYRCAALYAPPPGARFEMLASVTVNGVDDDPISGGLDTNSLGWPLMHAIVKFKPRYGTIDMGAVVSGYPVFQYRNQGQLEWSGWIYDTDIAGLAGNEIWRDFQCVPGIDWENIPITNPPTVFFELEHQNAMGIYDGNDVVHHYPLVPRPFQYVKTGTNTFQVHLAPQEARVKRPSMNSVQIAGGANRRFPATTSVESRNSWWLATNK